MFDRALLLLTEAADEAGASAGVEGERGGEEGAIILTSCCCCCCCIACTSCAIALTRASVDIMLLVV